MDCDTLRQCDRHMKDPRVQTRCARRLISSKCGLAVNGAFVLYCMDICLGGIQLQSSASVLRWASELGTGHASEYHVFFPRRMKPEVDGDAYVRSCHAVWWLVIALSFDFDKMFGAGIVPSWLEPWLGKGSSLALAMLASKACVPFKVPFVVYITPHVHR
eukprot:354232-Chlamydomonas_euryale.AAC.11